MTTPPAQTRQHHGNTVLPWSTVLPKNGLELPRVMPFDKWLFVGSLLSAVRNSSAWCLGDWLVYGETNFRSRYRDAIEQTSLDYQTLRNYAWVARRFPHPRRRDTLSFGHHAEVASLPEPEQDFWLRKAEEFRWPTSRLRREVRLSLSERDLADSVKTTRAITGEARGGNRDEAARPEGSGAHPPLRLQLKVTTAELELCKLAAGRAGLTVEAWAQRTLRDAASQADICLERSA